MYFCLGVAVMGQNPFLCSNPRGQTGYIPSPNKVTAKLVPLWSCIHIFQSHYVTFIQWPTPLQSYTPSGHLLLQWLHHGILSCYNICTKLKMPPSTFTVHSSFPGPLLDLRLDPSCCTYDGHYKFAPCSTGSHDFVFFSLAPKPFHSPLTLHVFPPSPLSFIFHWRTSIGSFKPFGLD